MATTQNKLSAEIRSLVNRLDNRNPGTEERDRAGFIMYASSQSAKPITEKTAKEYLRWLGKDYVLTKAKEIIPGDYSSLLEVNDIEGLERICAALVEDEENIQVYSGFPSAAVGKYKDYLLFLSESATPVVSPFIRNDVQKIVYGCPGSGKSWKVNHEEIIDSNHVFRTTFHPDADYASFVGTYKPIRKGQSITYEYVPQVFTDAYVAAWSNPQVKVYLVIEEINRGNCAQIFGDIFQLLDRKDDGFSEYSIKADHDLRDYLIEILGETSGGIKKGELTLPPNMGIIATMNTSDQSLFPMDSAFKRRWSWEYVPIDTSNPKSQFKITISNRTYKWSSFLNETNKRIHKLSDSEDKQLGNFFIKNNVDVEEFKSKVMFYLWNEVCKEYEHAGSFFRNRRDNDAEFTFNNLFPTNESTNDILQGFMEYLGVEEA